MWLLPPTLSSPPTAFPFNIHQPHMLFFWFLELTKHITTSGLWTCCSLCMESSFLQIFEFLLAIQVSAQMPNLRRHSPSHPLYSSHPLPCYGFHSTYFHLKLTCSSVHLFVVYLLYPESQSLESDGLVCIVHSRIFNAYIVSAWHMLGT